VVELLLNKVRVEFICLLFMVTITPAVAMDFTLDQSQSSCSLPAKDGDWGPAINCAIEYVHNTGGGILELPPGGIRTYSNIYLRENVEIKGNGRRLGAALHVSTCNSTPVLQTVGGSASGTMKLTNLTMLVDKPCASHKPTLYINTQASVTLNNVQIYHTVNNSTNYSNGRLEIISSPDVTLIDSNVWSQTMLGLGVFINDSNVFMQGIDFEGFEYGLKIKNTGINNNRKVVIEGGYFERVVWGIWFEDTKNSWLDRINISVRSRPVGHTGDSRGVYYSGNSSNNVIRSSFIGIANKSVYSFYSNVKSPNKNFVKHTTYVNTVKNAGQISFHWGKHI